MCSFLLQTPTVQLATMHCPPYKTDVEGLKSLYLVSEGKQYPNLQYELQGKYVREYAELNRICGYHGSQFGLDLDLNDYKQGFSIIGFDMSRHGQPNNPVGSAPRQGSITTHIKYSQAITDSHTYIFYMVS